MENAPSIKPPSFALCEAISKAGGQTHVAREFGLSPQAVHRWCKRGRCPAERVLELERLSGVSRSRLRPDIYPVDG